MTKLGVNIDHVATVRQARYRGRDTGEPDPVEAALACESAGAHGITAHLREDRRHVIDRDMYSLREKITTRLNFEMANVPEIVAIALDVKPDIVCIVPERREELTTEGGLNAVGNLSALKETCTKMSDTGIEVSLFIDPDESQVNSAAESGAGFIELHTGTYAEEFTNTDAREAELTRLAAAAKQAQDAGLQVNAGHGLNLQNVPILLKRVPGLVELNIGHTLISRAVMIGIEAAVKEMLALLD
ncbi:MAG: pyridoxine 5'-phosphate synthase [Verrucomicrobiales bacterium]|nr:pyridoxine 5'-phosphate synthase [Verrucomicrobiales bacterium]|tara:strand:+ start:2403 stop:3134 length:732 start_codon:yes stop_codon:yes gene_type:complete